MIELPTCIHFRGFQENHCKAGVSYRGGPGCHAAAIVLMPCQPTLRAIAEANGANLRPAVACANCVYPKGGGSK